MEVSRIFIKGLPPTITDLDFRTYFSHNGQYEITDAKLFGNRRIGYVGYRSTDEAQKAVKYFNKTFIRMSRISVELARPYTNGKPSQTAPGVLPNGATIVPGTNPQQKHGQHDGDGKQQDPDLKEYLEVMQPQSKKRKVWEAEGTKVVEEMGNEKAANSEQVFTGEDQSDDEYEDIPSKASKRQKVRLDPDENSEHNPIALNADIERVDQIGEEEEEAASRPTASDADWMRSRTNRVLGLLDGEDKSQNLGESSVQDAAQPGAATGTSTEHSKLQQQSTAEASVRPPQSEEKDSEVVDKDIETMRTTMRLFLRNLPYDVKVRDLEMEFEPFGHLEEAHVPLDRQNGRAKGFAYLQFSDADSAEAAWRTKDGATFQGRLLHILPAAAKRDGKLDEYELSKLPLKKQQMIKKRREAGSKSFNWNSLYMNADAVVSSVAERLGIAKNEVLDPTSSDAAVKQAQAETHVIQETKEYFRDHGIDLDAFKRSHRGDTAILVKNIPFECSRDELRRLFEEHGTITRFMMPPSGVLAIIEMANAAQCTKAYQALAYKRIKSSMLFLEKAPKDLFKADSKDGGDHVNLEIAEPKPSASDLKGTLSAVPDVTGATATLFVRNLNFSTTSAVLTEVFKPLEGFLSARVKTKTDPKRPGEVLSMGFGFLEFHSASQAQAAVKAMDGYSLDGHKLQLRASHKRATTAEEKRAADSAKRASSQRTKVVIKNLPFEATKKDVRTLFGSYGQLRSVRVPKKMNHGARGFAFADFTTPKEAESAIDALRDTHLLGRRLVLDFAAEDPEDAEAEIAKMQEKVGSQVNKIALQKLTAGGRKKFATQEAED